MVLKATIKEEREKMVTILIERYNPETTEKEDIEIPVYSNNPIAHKRKCWR